MTQPILYDYWRSSACYRVRIALNLKGVAYEAAPVNLLADEQMADAYKDENPQGLVPALAIGGRVLTQSLAIVEWLDATYAEPKLIPADTDDRAHVMAMALAIACDIHPVNNLRVLKYLARLGIDQGARDEWYRHWIAEGFAGLEALAAPRAGRFLFGDAPSLADICLVPQMYNARRLETPIDAYPTLLRADAAATALDAFAAAHPDRVAPAAAKG